MNGYHWLTILIVFVLGYVFARYFPQLGNTVGLP